MHGQQVGIGAVLDGALTMTMNQDGALLSLLLGVAADVHQGLDDIVEGVYIVVVEHQTAAVVLQHVGFRTLLPFGRETGSEVCPFIKFFLHPSFFIINATACEEMPSILPSNPRCSVVVAFTDTQSMSIPSVSAITCRICGI